MSYSSTHTTAVSPAFRSRVVIGAVDVAKDKAIDAQSTTDDKLFAVKVLKDPEYVGRMMAYGVSLLLSGNESATDAEIKAVIVTAWPFYGYALGG